MVFGIDIVHLLVNIVPVLPGTVIKGLPPAAADTGTWAGCIAKYGLTAVKCQGL